MYNSNHHSPHGRVIFHCSFAQFNLKTDITETQCPINLHSLVSFNIHIPLNCSCLLLQSITTCKSVDKNIMKGKMCFFLAACAIYLGKDNKWLVDCSPACCLVGD